MLQILLLIFLGIYSILGILLVRNQAKMVLTNAQKIYLLLVYLILFTLIVYAALFLLLFGYNS